MTTTTVPLDASLDDAAPVRPSRALAARRWFLVAAPVLAGIFLIVGAYADPAAGISGERMFRIYADNPGPLQFKSLGFHWAYAFWMAPALLIAPYVRGKGRALANVTAFVGFVGMTTLPGLLFTDWYDSAIGQLYGAEGVVAVQDQMSNGMWGIPVFTIPGMLGLLLTLPLAAITLWRAGLARWWALASVVAGFLAFSFSNVQWWGCAITLVCFSVFSVALARATRAG